ncbi:MAG TPA: EAL domain-containing protein [Acidimicrobiales bacterium]|nr:EAL domain-containing protein [Acidimicrobiales bacterium]
MEVRSGTRRRLALVAALVFIAVATFGVVAGAQYWKVRNDREASRTLQSQATTISEGLTRGLLQDSEILSASSALFHQGDMTRKQYVAYLDAVGFGTSRFPGLQGIGLLERLTPAQVPAFLASLRADGINTSLSPPGQRAQYCLGDYVASHDLPVAQALYGFDGCTVAALMPALQAAAATGQQQVIADDVLGTALRGDFVLVQPVYGAQPGAAGVTGWVMSIDNGTQLVRAFTGATDLRFAVYRGSGNDTGKDPVVLSSPKMQLGDWATSRVVDALGPWTIRFQATDAVPGKGSIAGPLLLLVLGLSAVAFLVAFLTVLFIGRRRAETAVGEAIEVVAIREERFRKLLASSADVIAILGPTGEVVYANPAAQATLGMSESSEPGVDTFSYVHPEDLDAARVTFAGALAEPGVPKTWVYRVRHASGDWRTYQGQVTNLLEDQSVAGVVVNASDVTEQTHLTRALRTLGQGTHELVLAGDEETLLAETCRTIVETGGYDHAWVGYVDPSDEDRIVQMAAAGPSDWLRGRALSWGDVVTDEGPTVRAIATGAIQVLDDIRQVPDMPGREEAERNGLRTICALPLSVRGRCIGALTILAKEVGAFGPKEVELLSQLGGALSYGIGRTRDAKELNQSEARFRSLTTAAPIGVLEVVPVGRVVYVNTKMAQIAGREPSELMEHRWIDAVHPQDRDELVGWVDQTWGSMEMVTNQFRIIRPGGEVRHVRLSASPKSDRVDDGFVVTIEDISEEVATQEALTHQAFYDALTGLPNRALLLDRLGNELAARERNGDNVAVIFLDLDHFKIVNDSLGHETGDAVLREVAHRFSTVVRAGETASRFSGDEFVFILRDIDDSSDALCAASRLLAVLAEPIEHQGRDLTVTASIGVVVPDTDADPSTVLRDADTAMYAAKVAGRNRVQLFGRELHQRSFERLALEGELREAISRQEFALHYQPVVHPAVGRPIGAEALMRWYHPERGLVPPGDFIPVAEDSGLITALGAWALDEALRQLAEWDADPDGPRLDVMSVNLSARQLDDHDTPAMVQAALERHGVHPGRLVLEITESAVIAQESALKALHDLVELGVRIAIDDFGTGYSSLAYLHGLPVHVVKIDRSFVSRIGERSRANAMVRAIVEMAHALHLSVVAEGVEEAQQRRFIEELGCDAAQGFLWSKPLPPCEFSARYPGLHARVVEDAALSS